MLTAPRMVCHLSDQLRVALGDLPSRPRGSLLTRTLVRWVVIHTGLQAPPGKVPTVPEMLTTAPGDWAADLAECESLVERAEWGILARSSPAAVRQVGPGSWCRWAPARLRCPVSAP
ncbi:MAG: hypothetical protein SGJ01_19860 [Gemmatimonadota bacterium]|nr:hypothetical protein [Gemmatimonadota bacterium]